MLRNLKTDPLEGGQYLPECHAFSGIKINRFFISLGGSA